MKPRAEVLSLLQGNLGFDGIFAVPGMFIALTGDTDSALLLSQLLYWTDRARDPGGWVFKARYEWCAELHMNRYRFDSARRRLRRLGLIEESHHLVGARRILHLRMRHAELCAVLRSLLPRAVPDGPSMNDPTPCRGTAVRPSGDRNAGASNVDTPEHRASEPRMVEDEPSGRSTSGHSGTETPAETPPESTTERSSAERAEGSAAARREDHGEKEEGAAEGRRPEKSGPFAHLSYRELCAVARHQAREQRRTAAGRPYEDRLFDTLERVRGFPGERDYRALNEVLEDHPGVDHPRELARFAGYWRDDRLLHPWAALRKWLERAAAASPPSWPREPSWGHAWRTAPASPA